MIKDNTENNAIDEFNKLFKQRAVSDLTDFQGRVTQKARLTKKENFRKIRQSIKYS